MGRIKDNWQLVLFTAFMTLVASLFLNYFTRSCERSEASASVSYVDQRNDELQQYVDQQDGIIKSELNACNSTTAARMDRIQSDIKTKADQADIEKLYSMTAENNRMLFEILKIIKTKE